MITYSIEYRLAGFRKSGITCFNILKRGIIYDNRFGVIGCGAVGAWHCIAIQDAYNSPHIADKAQLIGVTDALMPAQKYSERFGVPAFKTVEDMLACPDIHCVDICTPAVCMSTLPSCAAGKNVLIEKPMALTVEDYDRIIRAGDENRVKIGVVFQSRMHESARILKRIVNEGHLGRSSPPTCS